MNFQFLKLEKEDKIWTLSLNRPEALNALNSAVLAELSEALRAVEAAFPKDVLGLVITGAGEKSFVAGADIREMSGISSDEARRFSEKGQAVFRQIETLPVPVIAAVNGFALGGGLELALSCDFIYASETARLGLPEVTLGLIPGFGGTVRLARAVGLNRARELVMTGDAVKAPEALALGLVNKMLAPAELLPAAKKTLQTIASRGPVAVKLAKKTMLAAYDQDIQAALGTEAAAFGQLFSTQDAREGTSAFLDKRKAQFQGA